MVFVIGFLELFLNICFLSKFALESDVLSSKHGRGSL